ncbi:hypothetical protein AX279_10920 [Pseudomonas sp. J237]|nr:hypothetical protein AX279_10920 [Pseudomonas sp. J237]
MDLAQGIEQHIDFFRAAKPESSGLQNRGRFVKSLSNISTQQGVQGGSYCSIGPKSVYGVRLIRLCQEHLEDGGHLTFVIQASDRKNMRLQLVPVRRGRERRKAVIWRDYVTRTISLVIK